MVTWNPEDVARYESRQNPHDDDFDPSKAEIRESKLHDAIIAECKRRLWPFVHSRMDQATTTTQGVPDFIIFAEDGVVLQVEAKSRTGKASQAQLEWKAACERNGHGVYVCRSMSDFLLVITLETIKSQS